jgi:hypothetical protein
MKNLHQLNTEFTLILHNHSFLSSANLLTMVGLQLLTGNKYLINIISQLTDMLTVGTLIKLVIIL